MANLLNHHKAIFHEVVLTHDGEAMVIVPEVAMPFFNFALPFLFRFFLLFFIRQKWGRSPSQMRGWFFFSGNAIFFFYGKR